MRKAILNLVLAAILVMALPMAFAFDSNAKDISEKEIREKEGLLDRIPKTAEETEKMMSILPRQDRFILYTNDGKDIMWGTFADGYFRGLDNHGKNTWGIYTKTVFAGFYEGEFFYGRYRNGSWKAFGLLDKKTSSGKYLVFPSPYPALAAKA